MNDKGGLCRLNTRHLLGGRKGKSRMSKNRVSDRDGDEIEGEGERNSKASHDIEEAVLFAANEATDKPKLMEDDLDELMSRTRNRFCAFLLIGGCV